MGGLGSFRSVLRAFRPDPVRPAVPRRFRTRTAGSGRHCTWDSLTPVIQIPAHQGRGDHHRATGPGSGVGGGHEHGLALRSVVCSIRRPPPGSARSTLHLHVIASDGDIEEVSPPRQVRWPVPSNSATSSSSTTRTRSPSRTTPTSLCPRMWPKAVQGLWLARADRRQR